MRDDTPESIKAIDNHKVRTADASSPASEPSTGRTPGARGDAGVMTVEKTLSILEEGYPSWCQ